MKTFTPRLRRSNLARFASAGLSLLLPAAAPALLPVAAVRAADHGDAPLASRDRAADLADVYFFLDPNDNSKAVLIMTVYGFIVPGEAANFSAFDPNLKYVFNLENTGDATADASIHVKFTARTASTGPQTATVTLPDGRKFTAPTTPPTFAATPPEPVITHDDASNVDFFAGETDDPFFFDLVAFQRFAASVTAGTPDATVFSRGRDTFAGYNVQSIALRLPVSALKGPAGNVVGVRGITKRGTQSASSAGGVTATGPYRAIDRTAVPAVNVVLIPFLKKDAYNAATPEQDAAGTFVPDIVATLAPFGTDSTSINILASIAVTKGDYLRLDTSIPNTGTGGGNNAAAGFPNARRLGDDVVDTLLTVVNNRNALGDNVNGNDVPLRDAFPFLAPPQQPRANGVADDNTRN